MSNVTRTLPFLGAHAESARRSPFLLPAAIGLAGMIGLSAVYLGIVSLAESPRHAVELFWEDRWLVVPILLTFGVQVGLYAFVRAGSHLPARAAPRAAVTPARDAPLPREDEGMSAASGREAAPYVAGAAGASAAGGGVSTIAMVACCLHHVTDLLPVLGLGVAATLLTAWKMPLMALGLSTNLVGIAVMVWILRRDRRRAART